MADSSIETWSKGREGRYNFIVEKSVVFLNPKIMEGL